MSQQLSDSPARDTVDSERAATNTTVIHPTALRHMLDPQVPPPSRSGRSPYYCRIELDCTTKYIAQAVWWESRGPSSSAGASREIVSFRFRGSTGNGRECLPASKRGDNDVAFWAPTGIFVTRANNGSTVFTFSTDPAKATIGGAQANCDMHDPGYLSAVDAHAAATGTDLRVRMQYTFYGFDALPRFSNSAFMSLGTTGPYGVARRTDL
ncbi:hypothetical protein BH23ACT9_BH23ACT9_34450 [soil metagenome]